MELTSKRIGWLPLIGGVLCSVVGMSESWAQKPAGDSSAIEEVVVTARKTEESQQVVPVAITALSADKLEQIGVTNATELQTAVPGLLVAVNSQGSAPTFAIRAAKADNGTGDTVTAYIDDVPAASTRSIANMLYDMESISTFKGPQGTLFGANSTGGAIIFRPNKPAKEFGASVELGFGNYGRKAFQGMVNVPVNDSFQFRVAGEIVRRDGFTQNTTPIGDNGEMANDEHESARLSLRMEPGDAFRNDLTLEYYNHDAQPIQEITVALRPRYNYTTFLGPMFPQIPVDYALAGVTVANISRDRVSLGLRPTFDKARIYNVIDALNFDFSEAAAAKLVIGYQKVKLDTYQDNDGTRFSAVNGHTLIDTKQISVEPSIDWKFAEGRFRNKTGLYYADRKNTIGNAYTVIGLPWDFTGFGPAAATISGTLNNFYPINANSLYRRELKTKAIYTQFAFDISPATTLSVGGRYTKDTGHYIASNRTFLGAAGLATAGQFDSGPCSAGLATYDNFNAAACTGEQSLSTSSPSWTVTVDHRLSDNTMIYGTTRRGYIAGGFNNQAFSPATTGISRTFNPEKVTDLEFGLKSDWELGGRPIRTNLAAVFGKYKDQQRVQNGTTSTGTTFTGVVNAGKSKYWALDLDAVYKATDHLDLTLGWNHINSEYTEFNAIVAIPGVFAFVDLKGKEMSQTPKNVINAAVTVHWPAADSVGAISSTLSAYHRSDTLSKDSPTFGGTTNASGLVVSIDPAQDFRRYDVLHGFTQVNFTTSWKQMFGSKFDAQLSVKNLTDELYELAASNQMLQFGYANYYYGNPREYSVSLRYSF